MALSTDAPTWITAVGTVAAVAAALLIALGGWWLASRSGKERRPRLTLEQDEAWFESGLGWPNLRLAVVNEDGRDAAHDVIVSVEKITEGGIIHRPLNMSLPWTNLVESSQQLMTVPAGARRYVTVGSFVEDFDPEAIDGPTLRVTSRPHVYAGARLQHKPFVFDLTLTATNGDATAWSLTVDFAGVQDGERKKPQGVTLSVERSTRQP